MDKTTHDIHWARGVEILLVFVGIPLSYAAGLQLPDIALLPLLMGLTTLAIILLYRDPRFDRREFTRTRSLRNEWPSMLALLLVGAIALPTLAWLLVPDRFFYLPRHRPGLFVVILLVYPLLSVIPQEILWRTYFFNRFRNLLYRPWMMICASAATFAWMHVIFMNGVAVTLTLLGGLIFAWRYHRTRSLTIVCLEHTLWGSLVFATGLGTYFIHGTLAAVLHFVK